MKRTNPRKTNKFKRKIPKPSNKFKRKTIRINKHQKVAEMFISAYHMNLKAHIKYMNNLELLCYAHPLDREYLSMNLRII